MGVIHSRERNFYPAKCSTTLKRLNVWEQGPGPNWTNLKTLPRAYHNMKQAPRLCSSLCTSGSCWFCPMASSPHRGRPTSTQLVIKCLKFIFLLPRKKTTLCARRKKITQDMFFMGTNSVGANSQWDATGIIRTSRAKWPWSMFLNPSRVSAFRGNLPDVQITSGEVYWDYLHIIAIFCAIF